MCIISSFYHEKEQSRSTHRNQIPRQIGGVSIQTVVALDRVQYALQGIRDCIGISAQGGGEHTKGMIQSSERDDGKCGRLHDGGRGGGLVQ